MTAQLMSTPTEPYSWGWAGGSIGTSLLNTMVASATASYLASHLNPGILAGHAGAALVQQSLVHGYVVGLLVDGGHHRRRRGGPPKRCPVPVRTPTTRCGPGQPVTWAQATHWPPCTAHRRIRARPRQHDNHWQEAIGKQVPGAAATVSPAGPGT